MSSKVSCPGSSTMTSDGKACEVKLDIPLFCGLTADSAPGWPRCYGGDGAPLQPPPAPNADGGSSTGTGKSKLPISTKKSIWMPDRMKSSDTFESR